MVLLLYFLFQLTLFGEFVDSVRIFFFYLLVNKSCIHTVYMWIVCFVSFPGLDRKIWGPPGFAWVGEARRLQELLEFTEVSGLFYPR